MRRREHQRIVHYVAQLVPVVGETAARTAQRECRPEHYRIADARGGLDRLLGRSDDLRGQYRLAQAQTQILEHLSVLGLLDTAERCSEYLHLTLFENTLLGQLHGQIQPRLTAQSRYYRIGTLVADYLGDILQRQRLHVHLVGDMRIGHYGGRIRVYQNNLISLLLQGQTGLRAGVIELGGLTYDDRTRSDHHHFLYIGSLRHLCCPPSF